MTARRIREWPRVVAAGLAVAGLLVVIGVLVASGGSSGASASSTVALRRVEARQATELRHDGRQLASLRGQLSAATSELTLSRSQLASSRAHALCWRQLALHRAARRVSNCALS